MDIHQNISITLQLMSNHWDHLTENNRGVSRIDKDILLDDVRRLYEHLLQLEIEPSRPIETINKVSKIASQKDKEPKGRYLEKKRETETEGEGDLETRRDLGKGGDIETEGDIEPRGYIETEGEKEEDLEEKLNEKAKSETDAPAINPLSANIKPRPKNQKPLSNADKFAAPKTLADRFQHNDNSFAAKLKKNKMRDIKSAIGINERFLFINEIFKGDHQHYQQTLTNINTSASYHEALQYIERIKTENQIENTEAVATLLDIIKRKFK